MALFLPAAIQNERQTLGFVGVDQLKLFWRNIHCIGRSMSEMRFSWAGLILAPLRVPPALSVTFLRSLQGARPVLSFLLLRRACLPCGRMLMINIIQTHGHYGL